MKEQRSKKDKSILKTNRNIVNINITISIIILNVNDVNFLIKSQRLLNDKKKSSYKLSPVDTP